MIVHDVAADPNDLPPSAALYDPGRDMNVSYEGRSVVVHIVNDGIRGGWVGTITTQSNRGIELSGTWRFSQEPAPMPHRIFIPWTSVSYVEVA